MRRSGFLELWQVAGFGITHGFSTIAFALFAYFVKRLFQIKNTTREILPFLGVCIEWFALGLGFFVVSWFDYLRWEQGVFVLELIKINMGLLMVTMACVIFIVEYVLKRTIYIITAYVIVGTLIGSLINVNYDIYQLWWLILFIPLIFLLPLLWFWIFIKPTSGSLRNRMTLALIGVILLILGAGARWDLFIKDLGLQIFYVLGSLILVVGLCLVGYGFTGFSTFSDLGWKKKVRELFVISKNGISLYAFSFEKDLPIKDSDLVAGGFSGVQLLLSEMVKTKESLQLLDYQNLKIMIEQTEDVMFILILKEASKVLQYKLKLFSHEFRLFFKDVLSQWKGDTGVFRPTKTLIERVFELHSV